MTLTIWIRNNMHMYLHIHNVWYIYIYIYLFTYICIHTHVQIYRSIFLPTCCINMCRCTYHGRFRPSRPGKRVAQAQIGDLEVGGNLSGCGVEKQWKHWMGWKRVSWWCSKWFKVSLASCSGSKTQQIWWISSFISYNEAHNHDE